MRYALLLPIALLALAGMQRVGARQPAPGNIHYHRDPAAAADVQHHLDDRYPVALADRLPD